MKRLHEGGGYLFYLGFFFSVIVIFSKINLIPWFKDVAFGLEDDIS
jgi:hypothetical protein